MLSNIFLHHVLDKWFEDVVRPRMRGKATLVRFADDFVMTFETYHDAKRVMDVLGKRLDRFGLTLHPDKTHFIDFRPQRHGGTPPDCKVQSFDFLGFTHSWGKSRKGKDVVRKTTAKSRFARSLAAVKAWCRTNRHQPAREQRAWLSAVLNGHYAYYGVTGNIRPLQEYRTKSCGSGTSGWKVEREDGCSYGTASTRSSPGIRCQRPGSSTATPAATNLSREESDAGNLRVRICGGRGGQRPRLPGMERAWRQQV